MDLANVIDRLVELIPDLQVRERLLRGRMESPDEAAVASVPAPLHAALWNTEPGEELFDCYTPLTLEGCLAEKQMMDKLLADGSFEVDPGEAPWWDPRWWPIASDGCGQLVCWNRESNEVLEFLHDDPLRANFGDNLVGFFGGLLAEVERGDSSWRDNYGWVTSDLQRRLDEYAKQKAAAPPKRNEINLVGGLLYLGFLVCVIIGLIIWLW